MIHINTHLTSILFALTIFTAASARAQDQPFTKTTDILYATAIGDAPVPHPPHQLLLDLYLPKTQPDQPAPNLIVWVHGGAWRSGSKNKTPLTPLLDHGYAIASIDYRLSPVAPFPAQIHDIKAAIRFLRAKQKQYGYNAQRIAIAGSSAGGHLVALMGVTNNHKKLEGAVGDHTNQSSSVQATIDLYGPTNFLTILPQSTPHGLGVRIPALQLLLRAQPENTPDLAQLASPVNHVDPSDPPLLILHGDQDPQVPINQSHELHALYKQHNLPVIFEVVHGAAHGGKQFYDERRMKLMLDFLGEHIRK
jgi:acetyl esterase/lipase